MKRALVLLAIVALAFTSCKKDNLNLEEKIIGKWMMAERDGLARPTNNKFVYTFVSPTKAYMSVSFAPDSQENAPWHDLMEGDAVIEGNKVTITFHRDEHLTLVHEFIFTDITANEFTANLKATETTDGNVTEGGNVVLSRQGAMRFTKLNVDHRDAILGKWECTEQTGIETYNDANARLEFFADGNYNYWRKNDNGGWEAVTDREFQNYFVDGTLLATRWKNIGEDELREWWEIASIANGEMQWTALRQNGDGTTVQQGMKWVKVD